MSDVLDGQELTPIDPEAEGQTGEAGMPHAEGGDGHAEGVTADGSAQASSPEETDAAVATAAEEAPEGEEADESYTDEESAELRNVVESLVFASDEPISAKFIRQIVEEVNKDRTEGNRIRCTTQGIKRAVAAINRQYDDRAFHIIPIAGGFTFATKPKYSAFVGKLAKEKARRKLSATAIETLAIIAYKQPITKSEIEFIRGVNADYIIKTLLEKNLISITGRASTPGRPLLYGTTEHFLMHFGLNEISDLPKPREIEELIGETELEVEKRLLAEQQELEFKEELQQKMEGGAPKAKSNGPRPPLRQPSAPTVKSVEPPVSTPPETAQEPPISTPPETVPEPQATTPEITPEPAAEEIVIESAVEETVIEPAAEEITSEPEVGEIALEPEAEESAPNAEAFELEAQIGTTEAIPVEEAAPDEMDEASVGVVEPEPAEAVTEEPAVELETVPEVVEETPIIEEPPIVEETPIIEEPPIVEESLVVEESPVVEEPAVTEESAIMEDASADEEPAIAIVEEMNLPEEFVEPVAEETPAVEETTPEPVELPPEEEEPVEPAPDAVGDAMASGNEEPAHTEEHPEHEKGWSKWKTKIKTFFKKLFV